MKKKRGSSSRRRFLSQGVLLGGGALAGLAGAGKPSEGEGNDILKSRRPDSSYPLNRAENVIYSSCLNCNTGCGIKCKIQEGVLTKIDGNPYNPWTLVPHLPMSATVDEAAAVDGGLCPKGQAGVQIHYDPYRIRTVLKRAGRRGENKWRIISFEQAVAEIVEGGRLFAHVPGEETREVEGLRSLMALRDDAPARDMASDVETIWREPSREQKKNLVEAFKAKHARFLDALIDPNHPDLGPRNNQFVLAWGRLKNGRKDFFSRFGDSYGTRNLHGHTTVCQGSLYFTCKAISEQYKDGKFVDGKKFYWQVDLEKTRYVVFVGANVFEANYGPTNRTVRLVENLSKGRVKFAVVDPRFSKLASKAHKWLPVKPGEDAALGLAMIQWILAQKRHDETFLKNANAAAARAAGESSWSNATWLVEIKDGRPGQFVRAYDLGLASEKDRERYLVVLENGVPRRVDPNDETTAVFGDLFADTEIPTRSGGSLRVKSSLQLLRESSEEKSFDEWCEMAGVAARDVIAVARELTRYGKQAGIDIHRGPAQHTNGFYNVLTWMSLNILLGNIDWAGGLSKATTYGYDGSKGGPFNLKRMNGKVAPFGVSLIRHDVAYEETTLFQGYPARRNWYPLSSDIYQEIVPSIEDAYPYPVKALFLYMGAPTYSLPAGQTNIRTLADVDKLPLFFASDIIIGPATLYADYLFPDLSYLERWEFQGSHPNMINKVEVIRQPAAAPLPETATVYGEEMPLSLEAVLMALAEKLGLKSFGKDALGPGLNFNRPEDFYLRAVANIAFGSGGGEEVPDADEREMAVFREARRHLPPSVFDEAKWRRVVGDAAWKKVVFVLNRGGRYEDHERGYDGEKLRHRYAALLNIYQEKTAGNRYSGTGESYPGIAAYVPIALYSGQSVDELSEGYDLHLITHRTITQTKARTIGAYWLQPMLPENGIIINPRDAERLSLSHGDRVKVVSATNPEGVWDLRNGRTIEMSGKLVLTETIRPGVISFVLGFGHWALGASDFSIDGRLIRGDGSRARGLHANAAMWTDASLRNNTCLIDPVGGSVSFYDTRVKLIKIS